MVGRCLREDSGDPLCPAGLKFKLHPCFIQQVPAQPQPRARGSLERYPDSLRLPEPSGGAWPSLRVDLQTGQFSTRGREPGFQQDADLEADITRFCLDPSRDGELTPRHSVTLLVPSAGLMIIPCFLVCFYLLGVAVGGLGSDTCA